MAKTYKILGQSAPDATTNADVYSVPSSTQAVVSSLTVCNRANSSATYRIAVRPNNATLSNEHYIAYEASIPANDTIILTIGITVSENDRITVYSSNANLTFSVFGSEIA
jgi:hypothetical protein